jgi:hypothetical protein
VNFEPSWGMPLIAKLMVAGAILGLAIIVLLSLVIYRMVRRFARGRRGEALG